MKEIIAISSDSNNLDGEVDPRFGRAAGFIIFDLKNNEFKYMDNGSSQTMRQGAGIKTASKLVNENVKVVLTGFVGPKAYRVLKSAGIKTIQDLFGISVKKVINLYKEGKIISSTIPKGKPKKIGR